MQPPYPGMPVEELIAFRETDEAKNLVGWIKGQYQKCKDLRAKEERQWNLNLAMYNGNQWVQFFSDNSPTLAGRLGVPTSVRNRERQTINRIKPIVRTEMAKFISQKPGASVIPATDEDDDILAAVAAEQVWQSTLQRRRLEEAYEDAVFWLGVTGNGFVKVTWNPELKDDTGEVLGDIDFASIDPYKIFVPDIKTNLLEDMPYVIHAYAKSLEWLKVNYADALNGVGLNPSCNEAASIQAEAYAEGTQGDKKPVFDACMLYELWIKPKQNKLFPNGGMVVMIDDIIVEIHKDKMPYDHGEFPFAHLGHIKREGFYRSSVIEELIDLQRDYNKLRSQIAESRKKMAKPQLTAQKGAVSAAKITNEVGLLIEYKAGMQAPQPLALQNIPQYVMQEVEFILRDMEDISGQHEVSKGQTPTGVSAATAIAYLQESDDSFRLPSFKNIEAGYGKIARHVLQLFVQFVDSERLVKVIGKDDAFSTLLLSGADIKRATDIRIEPGSALPESKAARQAFIMDLMTNGFVDPNEGLDMLQIGGTQKLLDTIKNDKRQAQRENIKMKRVTEDDLAQYEEQWSQVMAQQMPDAMSATGDLVDPASGQPLLPPLLIPVNDWDNHEVHIEEHNRFRRTQEFEILPPQVKELFQSHVMMHKQMLMGVDPATGMPPADQGEAPPSPDGPVDLSQSGGGMPAAEPSATPEMPQDQPPMDAPPGGLNA